MAKLRDQLVILVLVSTIEAYIFIHYTSLVAVAGLGRAIPSFLVTNAALLVCYKVFVYPFLLSPLRNIPGPPSRGNFLIGHGLAIFSKPPGDRMLKWVDSVPNNGLIFFRGFFNSLNVIATSPETLKTVLSDNTYDYEKPTKFVSILRRVLGDGAILSEGQSHKFQRQHLTPSFQVRVIRDLYSLFWQKSCELNSRITDENSENASFEIEFGEWCMRATLDIIGVAGFGRDFGALKNPKDKLVNFYSQILEPDKEKLIWFALSVIFPQWIITNLPWRINRGFSGIQSGLKRFALNMVKKRRAELATEKLLKSSSGTAVNGHAENGHTPQRNDILSLLVRSNEFTDRELSEQVLTMMAAGHETTSSALSWSTYLLATHPDIQKRVREEVRAALPSPDSGIPVNAAQIDSLTWLNAVCLEVLRLYPAVPLTMREVVTEETPLGGYMLPKGTVVMLVPWAINRSRKFWGDDAQEFKPERWINSDGSTNKNGGSTSNYAQMTFLHGPRSCIGQGFAQSELKCLLAAFVGRFEFGLSRDASQYIPAGLITTRVQGGMWLRVKTVEGW